MNHSTNLQAVGNALFNTENSQCMGIAYGWAEPAKYDEKGLITNPEALQPSAEAAANAKLWAAAPALLEFYKAATGMSNTIGHEDATVDDENKAEARYDAALAVVRAALK